MPKRQHPSMPLTTATRLSWAYAACRSGARRHDRGETPSPCRTGQKRHRYRIRSALCERSSCSTAVRARVLGVEGTGRRPTTARNAPQRRVRGSCASAERPAASDGAGRRPPPTAFVAVHTSDVNTSCIAWHGSGGRVGVARVRLEGGRRRLHKADRARKGAKVEHLVRVQT